MVAVSGGFFVDAQVAHFPILLITSSKDESFNGENFPA